jgi:hypothetical protein
MCGGSVTTSRRIRTGPSRRAERGLFNAIWCRNRHRGALAEPHSAEQRFQKLIIRTTGTCSTTPSKPAEGRPVDGNIKHNKRRILVSNIAQKPKRPTE